MSEDEWVFKFEQTGTCSSSDAWLANLLRKLAFTQVYLGFPMETEFCYISDASKVAY